MIDSLNRVEISLPSLRHNYSLIRKKAQGAAVLAMVKADGYGHGMVECAKVLAAEGAACFGVAEPAEGVELRTQGIRQPVFVLTGILPELVPTLFKYRLTPVVVDDRCLDALSQEAVRRQQQILLHLKVDAGMGRQGCALADMVAMVDKIQSLPGLSLAGLLTHFPMADNPASDSTGRLTRLFCREFAKVQPLLPSDTVLHLANSGGILYFPISHQQMVRPGISLYGYYPDGEAGRARAAEPRLQPVMRFVSRITQVKEVGPGTGLGYGHTYTTDRASRLAIIPVGYADGYLRSLSNTGQVLVRGRRVPVVGRVSMNLTILDITDVQETCPGDEVVLLGRQGAEEITADEIGAWMDTISYEVLCLIGNLNTRVYL